MVLKYIVEGRKWFDKVNGNTYHSIVITDAETNTMLYHSPLTYGYGDAYRQTAMDYLIKEGLWNAENRFNHKLIGEKFHFTVEENCLRREL
jgi:hypothetical protein